MTATPLTDLTNAAEESRTPIKPTAADVDAAPPPPPPADEAEKADVPPQPADETPPTNGGKLLSLLRFEHPHSAATFLVGNACFLFLPMLEISPVNVAAWCSLLLLCVGGGAAVFGATTSRVPTAITEADLQPATAYVVEAANAALQAYHALFCCGQPRAALEAAVTIWALALVSARVSTMSLLWCAFALAFVVPTAQRKFRSQIEAATAWAVEELHKGGNTALDKAWKERSPTERAPVVMIVISLAWYCVSYSTVMITMGVGCIGFQAWRDANPKNAESGMAVVHTIKSRARRMSISAGEVLRHGASAVGKSL